MLKDSALSVALSVRSYIIFYKFEKPCEPQNPLTYETFQIDHCLVSVMLHADPVSCDDLSG